MNKAMKLLLSLVVAAFGFGVAASGASAAPLVGAAPGGGAFTIAGPIASNSDSFSIQGGAAIVTCTTGSFTNLRGYGTTGAAGANVPGWLPSPTGNQVMFQPAYSGCTVDFGIGFPCAATVTNNGTSARRWSIFANTRLSGGAGSTGAGAVGAVYGGEVRLEGPNPNTVITVNDPNCGIVCTINVPTQTVTPSPANALTATNATASSVRLAGHTGAVIGYSIASGQTSCPLTAGSFTDGDYTIHTGGTTVTGITIWG